MRAKSWASLRNTSSKTAHWRKQGRYRENPMLQGDLSKFDAANPQPGIYPDLSYEQFDAIDAIRPTHVQGWMQTCPAEVLWKMENDTSTDATDFGKAFHTKLLEPHLFDDLFCFKPKDIDRRTKIGKAKWEEFSGSIGDRIILKSSKTMPNPHASLEGMAESLVSHGRASPYVTGGQPEITIVWIDKHSTPEKPVEILCKTRIDYLKGKVAIDLKSIADPNANSVMREASRRWWRIQAAMAWDGLKALGREIEHYLYIAVGKKEPWLVNVLQAQWNYLESGRSAYHYALPSIQKSKLTGVWPGHASFDLEEIDLAPWDS